MIRFCGRTLLNNRQLQSAYEISPIMLDRDIWKNGRTFFKYNREEYAVLPVINQSGEIICYAYQDQEADRELRMIRELREKPESLKFSEVFPDYGCVTIQGFNELAFACAEYLKEQGVEVRVSGDYWEDLDWHASCGESGKNPFTIYAEGIRPKREWYHNFLTSVSVEFECIDRIYEENLLYSRITDTDKSSQELIETLHEEKNIIIIGDEVPSQDTYDFLSGKGIDIYGFLAQKGETRKRLLGKPVIQFDEALEKIENPVFIQCTDKNSALGSRETDQYDYYGYRRNQNFYTIRDYMEIPDSSLLNVLDNKRVVLLGDYRLCETLDTYLAERINIEARFQKITEDIEADADEIVLLVWPEMSYNVIPHVYEKNLELINRHKKYKDYTAYFSRHEAFSVINTAQDKYPHAHLRPKGILLGKSKGLSGNVFFRGVVDGHPNILLIKRDFCFNLFWYCIRLANVKAENIVSEFWKMYEEENDKEVIKEDFPQRDKFTAKIEELTEKGTSYTAQEIFVLLHMAHAAMWDEKREADISGMVIYWEPHIGQVFPESSEVVSYFAKWLESTDIQGNTMILCRNAIIRGASHVDRFGITQKNEKSINRYQMAVFSEVEQSRICYKYWKEFAVRFEDIKLEPRSELQKICRIIDIPWSETMLQTTDHEKTDSLFGVTGFDLGPVYNIRDYYLSAFDRMKIALGSAEIQMRYGYPSVNIMNFSRRELQEIFLKHLRVQSKMHFKDKDAYAAYFLKLQIAVRGQLWKIRKTALLGCIQKYNKWIAIDKRLFDKVLACVTKDLYSDDVIDAQDNIFRWIYIYQHQIDEMLSMVCDIRRANRIIFYGTGRDAEGLLQLLDQTDRDRILFADKKALDDNFTFYGKRVMSTTEVAEASCEYPVLITSSYYFREIEQELLAAGIDKSRIMVNTHGFVTKTD